MGCHFVFQGIFPTQGSKLAPALQADPLLSATGKLIAKVIGKEREVGSDCLWGKETGVMHGNRGLESGSFHFLTCMVVIQDTLYFSVC